MRLFGGKGWQSRSQLILWACRRSWYLIENLVRALFDGIFFGLSFWCSLCPSSFPERQPAFCWFASWLTILVPFGLVQGSESAGILISCIPLCCVTPFLERALVTAHPGTVSPHLSSTWPPAVRKNRASACLAVPPATTASIAKQPLCQSQEENEGILGFGTPPLPRH